MYKKVIISLLLLAVALAPVSGVAAKPKAIILIEEIVYTVKDVPVPDYIAKKVKGPILYAEGVGTINCNGVEACHEAGLHNQPVTIQQGFTGTYIEEYHEGLDAFTVGRLHLPGEYPAIHFKGKGDGTAECSDGTCHLTMEFNTKTKRGGNIVFRLDIDHTSAGFAETFGGEAAFTGAIIAMQRESE
jgi:hypothetical protein